MTIITWNCNMAFRKKAAAILAHRPDILVVPECEHPDRLQFPSDLPKPTATLWFGQNQSKGLGVFAFNGFRLRTLSVHEEQFRMVVPIAVSGPGIRFTLFAVWANNPHDKDGAYVTQVWKALQHYDALLRPRRVVLAGDFNSNTIWDRPRRAGNHSTVVSLLESRGIFSVYHRHFEQVQGKEAHPTYYLYRHENKPYHLDYCFASKDLTRHLQSVAIGDHATWCGMSDHVPLIATFGASLRKRD